MVPVSRSDWPSTRTPSRNSSPYSSVTYASLRRVTRQPAHKGCIWRCAWHTASLVVRALIQAPCAHAVHR